MSFEIVEDESENKSDKESTQEKYLLFRVGSEHYGASLNEILEVLEPIETSSLPESRPDCLGVMNLRGEVISVYDLRIAFGTDPARTDDNFIIVIASDETKRAFLVDQMLDVHDFSDDQIENCPNIKSSLPKESLKGVGKIEKNLIYLIELRNLTAA